MKREKMNDEKMKKSIAQYKTRVDEINSKKHRTKAIEFGVQDITNVANLIHKSQEMKKMKKKLGLDSSKILK